MKSFSFNQQRLRKGKGIECHSTAQPFGHWPIIIWSHSNCWRILVHQFKSASVNICVHLMWWRFCWMQKNSLFVHCPEIRTCSQVCVFGVYRAVLAGLLSQGHSTTGWDQLCFLRCFYSSSDDNIMSVICPFIFAGISFQIKKQNKTMRSNSISAVIEFYGICYWKNTFKIIPEIRIRLKVPFNWEEC